MQPCVIDSCSFLHSFHIHIRGVPLSEFLETHFDMLVHRSVLSEVDQVLPRAYRSWREKGLVLEEMSEIRRKHAMWVSTKCSDLSIDAPLEAIRPNGISHLDYGEQVSIALTKHTSDDRILYALLLTDDYDAGVTAGAIFQKYQCGFVVRTADVICFFGLKYKYSVGDIHQALRDLLSFYTHIYDSLMIEAKSLLPGGESNPITYLLLRGEFEKAKAAIRSVDVSSATRSTLRSLIDQASALVGDESIRGYTLACLRRITTFSS